MIVFLTVFIDLLGFGIVLPLLPRYAAWFNASKMQLGLLMRTPRGRLLSEGGYRHLGIAMPKAQKQQLDLLAGNAAEEG